MNEEKIFATAMKLTGDDRAAYLDEACGSDIDLRSRVEALVAAHDNPDSFLDAPALGVSETMDCAPLTERPGTTIGLYKLREQIGEGGMGSVIVAEQE